MPNAALEQAFAPFVGQEFGPPETGRDAVNDPMIRQWCDAMGDRNPVYVDPDSAKQSAHGGIVAPPAMLQAWILPGFRMSDPDRPPQDRQEELHSLFQEHGYTGVLATNCDLEFERYLKPGESVTAHALIESISEEKATAVGIGYFIVTRTTFSAGGEDVGSMVFRVLRFKPAQQQAPAAAAPSVPVRIRPPRGHDNGWWWDAIDRGELMIQKCASCGVLRHPPRPMCPHCQSTEWEMQPARGTGTLHTYTVMHHPQIPGYGFPIAVGLIDLEEGTRIVANIVDCEFDDIHIGMKLEASIEEVDAGGLKLPVFRPVQ